MLKKNISERLSELMQLLGMTQQDFGKKIGLPKSTLSMYLSGERAPKQDRISMIAEKCNVSETWLLGYDVPMKKEPYSDESAVLAAKMATVEPIVLKMVSDTLNDWRKKEIMELLSDMTDEQLEYMISTAKIILKK